MSLQGKLSWTVALRDLKSDRAPRAEIRTERMRSTHLALAGEPMLAWRGRSKRRYLCTVHGLDVAAPAVPSVVIAARAIPLGHAVVSTRIVTADDPGFPAWRAAARAAGATELHVFDPAFAPEVGADLRAVVEDLTEPMAAKAAA